MQFVSKYAHFLKKHHFITRKKEIFAYFSFKNVYLCQNPYLNNMKTHLLTALLWGMMCAIPMQASSHLISFPFFIKDTGRSERKYEPCDPYKYQSNMTMIAIVQQQGAVVADCEVAVFDSKGECRASSFSTPADNHRVYLTIQGENGGEPLMFRVVYPGTEGMVDVVATETYTYMSDAMVGTFAAPFVLNIPAETTGVSSTAAHDICVQPLTGAIAIETDKKTEVRICSIEGWVRTLRVSGRQVVSLPAGAYVVNGKKIIVK